MGVNKKGGLVGGFDQLRSPDAPTISVTPGNQQVSVAFTNPSDVGGGAISSYTATAIASGVSTGASSSSSPVVITGLTNGTSYSVTGLANNAFGQSPYSSATSSSLALFGSTEFDGSGDYLQVPSTSDFSFGTGDFTIECFFNRDVTGGLFQLSANSNGYTTDTGNSLAIGISGGSGHPFRIYSKAGGNDLTSTSPSADAWHHVAMVRNSSDDTLKIYLDGTLFHTVSSETTNYTYTYLAIGVFYSTSYPLNGHISNFRILKGTALYTSNFTPPTSPLTAITNTVLLTCQNSTGTITDASSSSHSITANGNAAADTIHPF
jgi:hypothetical protein